jgi:uncharacterized protein YpmB
MVGIFCANQESIQQHCLVRWNKISCKSKTNIIINIIIIIIITTTTTTIIIFVCSINPYPAKGLQMQNKSTTFLAQQKMNMMYNTASKYLSL